MPTKINYSGQVSNGGGTKFTLVNENTTLTSSGYYFTDTLALDITIDCSNLGIGEHINWLNLSTRSVVFSGLDSIDSASIPANKGVRVLPGNSIEFFFKDGSKNIKKLQGTNDIYWIHGQEPLAPTYRYWKIEWQGILSEIQFGLDAPYILNSSNGVTNTSLSGVSNNTGSLFDGVLSTGNNQYIGTNFNGSWCSATITFNADTPVLKTWFAPQGTTNSVIYNCPRTINVYGSGDGNVFALVKSLSVYSGFDNVISSPFNGTLIRPGILVDFSLI